MNGILSVLTGSGVTVSDVLVIGVVLLSLIQITPLKLNPWSAIARALGDAINKGLCSKIDDMDNKICGLSNQIANVKSDVEGLSDKVMDIQDRNAESRAVEARIRILHFCDGLMEERHYSKDSFEQTLADIDQYEIYTREHPDFKNNQTVATIDYIKERYQEMLKNHSFRQIS